MLGEGGILYLELRKNSPNIAEKFLRSHEVFFTCIHRVGLSDMTKKRVKDFEFK